MIRQLLIGATALVVVMSASAADGGNNLVLSGALNTSSARGVTPNESGCDVRRGKLVFGSGAMLLGRGPAVARVSFEIVFRGRGAYEATRPLAAYGRTPLQLGIGRNATTGAGAVYSARTGHIWIAELSANGRRLRSASGRMQADFRVRGRTVHVGGSWRCSAVSY